MRTLLLALLWTLLLPLDAGAQPLWRVYTHSAGDQTVLEQGELRGKPGGGKRAYYLELVRALLAQLGQPSRIEEAPLARGLLMLQSEDRIAFFNVNRTPEREDDMQWVGPISQESFVLYENSQRPTGIQTLAQGRELPVCVVQGSVHAKVLEEQGYKQFTRHNAYSGCLRMLALGRVRLAVATASGPRDAQLTAEQVRATPVTVHQAQGFVALSRSTPPAELQRWRQALQQLSQSGQLKALWEQYGQQ